MGRQPDETVSSDAGLFPYRDLVILAASKQQARDRDEGQSMPMIHPPLPPVESRTDDGIPTAMPIAMIRRLLTIAFHSLGAFGVDVCDLEAKRLNSVTEHAQVW